MPSFGFNLPKPEFDWKPWLLPAPIVTKQNGYYVVREELCLAGDKGANGTKARALWALSLAAKTKGYGGFVTAGGRSSTQSLMCCRIAQALGFQFEYHCPTGKDTKILETIKEAGFPIVRHRPGYGTVCRKRAKDAATEKGWYYIDTGVEGPEMPEIVAQAASQVDFSVADRLIVPVGSGMTLSGILLALSRLEKRPERILGVYVGNSPKRRLAKWGPSGCCLWEGFSLKEAGVKFETPGLDTLGEVVCDPHYSGKAAKFVRRGDIFWNSGSRHIALEMP